MAALLHLLAESGLSTAVDLAHVWGVDRKIIHRIIDDLAEGGLLKKVILPAGNASLTVVSLSDAGKQAALDSGAKKVVESDWERLIRLHRGADQPKHSALVLMAAYQARVRSWTAEVVPFNPQETPWFQPDLKLVDPEGWVYYCEAETRSRVNPTKWERMRQVNLVVPTPNVRFFVVQRLKTMGIPGRATDLRSLAKMTKVGELSRFWLEKW